MRTADFEYLLPESLIAQEARPRGTSRVLVLDRGTGGLTFTRFSALPGLLGPGDLLLLNEVRVIPARLRAHRPGGGDAELLLVRPLDGSTWEVMARPAKRLRRDVPLALARGSAIPRERLDEGTWRVEFDPPPQPRSCGNATGQVQHSSRQLHLVAAARHRAVAPPGSHG